MPFFNVLAEGQLDDDAPNLDSVTVNLIYALKCGTYVGNRRVSTHPSYCGCGLKRWRIFDVYTITTAGTEHLVAAQVLHLVSCHRISLIPSEWNILHRLGNAPGVNTEKLAALGEKLRSSLTFSQDDLAIFDEEPMP